ncbi:MAG: hypothetical protein P4L64_10745 [Caulobacteraceae bacterium]|nr:hypothetical protein [Caulobacteraceae bacterium]
MKRIAILIAAAGLSIGLSACSGGSSSAPTPPAPPKLEDKFGAGFGQDFRADPATTPGKVKSGDVIPVDPAAAPTNLH